MSGANASAATQPGLRLAALRQAVPVPLDVDLVAGCLDAGAVGDAAFERVWRDVMSGRVPVRLAGALSPVTGHVAESVAAAVLVTLGYQVVWQLTGPGSHGVDLVMLDPLGSTLVAWEVKGTLRTLGWPQLTGRERRQMGVEWIDKDDNPGIAEWGLAAADVVGGVVIIRFPQMEARFGVTADYRSLVPIRAVEELADLSWVWT
jgi:hypothetical protein